jgi:hypothetical protein
MSLPRLVRNSSDLARLVNEGYAVRILAGHLVIDDIPFATADKTVVRGSLICPLDLQGDKAARPSTHVMWFSHLPYTHEGVEMTYLLHQRGPMQLADGLTAACSSSMKAHGRAYENYYDKVVAYSRLIIPHAQAIDPTAVPTTYRVVPSDDVDSVFQYLDTNSSRAGITALSERLAIPKIAIVGLGGTGSYLLDLLAKTPIIEIHLYDGDIFSTHNSYRAPAAATIEELNAAIPKATYHAARYEHLRRGIHPHVAYVTADNVNELLNMSFVFLAMDASADKKVVVDALTDADVPFIDSGVGVRHDPDGLAGLVRTTVSLPGQRNHIVDDKLLSYELGDGAEYDANIQVAELNALAAAHAVIAFKKRYGFYSDRENELHSLYRIDSNELINDYGNSATAEDDDPATSEPV